MLHTCIYNVHTISWLLLQCRVLGYFFTCSRWNSDASMTSVFPPSPDIPSLSAKTPLASKIRPDCCLSRRRSAGVHWNHVHLRRNHVISACLLLTLCVLKSFSFLLHVFCSLRRKGCRNSTSLSCSWASLWLAVMVWRCGVVTRCCGGY